MMIMISIIMITGYSLNDDCVIVVDDDNDRVVVVHAIVTRNCQIIVRNLTQ